VTFSGWQPTYGRKLRIDWTLAFFLLKISANSETANSKGFAVLRTVSHTGHTQVTHKSTNTKTTSKDAAPPTACACACESHEPEAFLGVGERWWIGWKSTCL
jgi:hypothetical protein